MKRKAQLIIYVEDEIIKQNICDIVKDDAKEIKISRFRVEVTIYKEKPSYEMLEKLLLDNGIKYSYFEDQEYTAKEMALAEYFRLYVYYPWELNSKHAEDFGTKFDDFSGCLECGRGRSQIGPLIVDTKRLKGMQFATIVPEIIVSSNVKFICERDRLTGMRFGDVLDYKNRDFGVKYYQMFVENTLPPLNENVRVLRESVGKRCKNCDTISYYVRSELIYDKTHIKQFKDFNMTYEPIEG